MVALEFLRNKAAIFVAVIIGLALFAFVLSDLFTSGRSVFSANEMEVGHVGGTTIDYPQYQSQVEYQLQLQQALGADPSNREVMENQTRQRVWETFVREEVLRKFCNATGLALTAEELSTYIMGDTPHPVVQQLFTNPQTGVFDKEQVVQFLQGLNEQATPEQRAYWLEMEKEIAGEQLQQKFVDLVANGVGYPMPLMQQSAETLGNTVSARYFYLPYSSIPDSSVKVSQADCRDYYERNLASFKREERRNISFVAFDLLPSAEDKNAALDSLSALLPDFAQTDDAALFAQQNGETPYRGQWKSREEVGAPLADWLFDTAKENEVSDIQNEGDKYYAVRLLARKTLPDSVHARHILFSAQRYPLERAQQLADSLNELLAKGADFAALAKQYSDDQGSKEKGGDLEWFGPNMMVKSFNDACFLGKKGDRLVKISQFGVHLIEILDQQGGTPRVDIVELSSKADAGRYTVQQLFQKASAFAAQAHSERPGWFARIFSSEKSFATRAIDHFDAQVEANTLLKRVADGVERSWPSISGMPNSREIIRWAFEARVGEVSQVFELQGSYVVAILTAIESNADGIATFDAVQDEVEREVRKEQIGRLLAQKLDSARAAGAESLDALASKFGAQVRIVDGVSYRSYALGQEGYEPAAIGVACSQAVGSISSPVRGNIGVFVLETTGEQPRGTVNLDKEREQKVKELRNRVAAAYAYDALVKMSDVKDNRAKFY